MELSKAARPPPAPPEDGGRGGGQEDESSVGGGGGAGGGGGVVSDPGHEKRGVRKREFTGGVQVPLGAQRQKLVSVSGLIWVRSTLCRF